MAWRCHLRYSSTVECRCYIETNLPLISYDELPFILNVDFLSLFLDINVVYSHNLCFHFLVQIFSHSTVPAILPWAPTIFFLVRSSFIPSLRNLTWSPEFLDDSLSVVLTSSPQFSKVSFLPFFLSLLLFMFFLLVVPAL